MNTNPKVDEFFENVQQWQDELKKLRSIVLECGLVEELKWRQPCYTFKGKNLIILGGFKTNCIISFFKGALLNDSEGILEKPGENTQSARVIRFTDIQQIIEKEATLKAYIYEAIEVEKAGLKVDTSNQPALDIPEELQQKMDAVSAFKTAFEGLTPGRQKAYIMFFAQAKQSKTRTARIEKFTPRILDGKGMNDCTCGLSKKMPGCDGSHRQLKDKAG